MEKDDRPRKILIVDDSDICRELTQLVLEDCGYQVVALEGPAGFLAALAEERPDLALVDVSMPAATGDQLVAGARRHEAPRCPIVFFSDRPDEELQRLAESSGAAGYIRKTADPGTLAESVARFLVRAC